MQTSGFRLQSSAVLTTAICLAAAMTGCGDETAGPAVAPASLVARAARRAYDGAPPVIPHKPLGSCTVCHTPTGRETPGVGFAPANPHWGSARDGALANCRQCHAFAVATDRFAHSEFRGLPQQRHDGLRPHNQAPPQIPHRTSMRENCAACHSGPAAREEIRCSHAERRNCRQCHLPRHATELAD